jgi:hypothetical protein
MGEVIWLMDTLDIADQTLLFITADNGAHDQTYQSNGHTPHLNYRGQKADIYEAGHRVPFLVRWPGVVEAGSSSDETICLTDFMATAAAVVGYELSADAGEDSYSILPVLLGQQITGTLREATVHHSLNGTFAIRQGDWKLTVDNEGSGGFTNPRVVDGPGTLYNLADDIAETNDLYDDNPDLVAEMWALLEQYQTSGRSTPLERNDEFWARPIIGCGDSLYEEYSEEVTKNIQDSCRTLDVAEDRRPGSSGYGGLIEVFGLDGKKLLELDGRKGSLHPEHLRLRPGLYLMRTGHGKVMTVFKR